MSSGSVTDTIKILSYKIIGLETEDNYLTKYFLMVDTAIVTSF